MTTELLERPVRTIELKAKTEDVPSREEALHECASCRHKSRVYLSAPTGTQTAAVWRCGLLSQKTQREVIVQPHENCFEHRSLSDYWEQTDLVLVR